MQNFAIEAFNFHHLALVCFQSFTDIQKWFASGPFCCITRVSVLQFSWVLFRVSI